MVFDAIVIGIGHAGTEAALALARLGCKTLALSISLDNAGFLACNPSIGGTAKGHLVCEIDALGGEMGNAADASLTQLRMLNSSKGPSVRSLRAQVDKHDYHKYIKKMLENENNLTLKQAQVKEIIVKNGRVFGVLTTLCQTYLAKKVIVATGVYLDSNIIIGDIIEAKGPSGFSRSDYLASNLKALGFQLRRFKTGTPARVCKNSVQLEKLEIQEGEDIPFSFSSTSKNVNKKKTVCYLGYTNENTHALIEKNLKKSPKYAGLIHGAGARYCPSIEDKVVRFSDKKRHSFFLEPEGEGTTESYVQGLSTSLPADIQEKMYKTIDGFSNVKIMRDAYAIEYECIDPLELFSTLESKKIGGLYFAGQINGTSGYEEAAAQGLIAGINAALAIRKKKPLILSRESSYIGVLINDLTMKGTEEPYRMLTSRAEFRLLLRQDNADLRLCELSKEVGLLQKEKYKKYTDKKKSIEEGEKLLTQKPPLELVKAYFNEIGEPPPAKAMKFEEIIRRNLVTQENFVNTFSEFKHILPLSLFDIFVKVKYSGYVEREKAQVKEKQKLANMEIPKNTNFSEIDGLRLEAREKLNKFRPLTIGAASNISGISPADITVLIIRLGKLSQ